MPEDKPPVKNPMKRPVPFSIGYFLIAFLTLTILQTYFFAPKIEDIAYSEFKALLRSGKIIECQIRDREIRGVMKANGSPAAAQGGKEQTVKTSGEVLFRTARVEDPNLVRELRAKKVKFTGSYAEPWLKTFFLAWVLPIGILILIWQIIFRRMNPAGSVMSFGRSRGKLVGNQDTKIRFSDVAGIDEAKEELQEVVEFLKTPEKFTSLGGKIPKGVLLVGVPGTGKTLLAKAVAGEAGVPFFSMSGSDFVEMFVGVGAARVRDMFSQADKNAPCIVFIDELDALGKARGVGLTAGHDEREQTLNQLLVEMDGFDSNRGVIIMGATNRPETLDPALLRPGRFDRHVVVDRPDLNGREAILKVHAKGVKLAEDVDLRVVASMTPGMVGADLANLVNEAALLAARRDKEAVTMAEFGEAIDRVVAGLEKKKRLINEREKEIVAYHECGHALVATLVPAGDPVRKISMIPRGVAALGYTLQAPTEDRYLMTEAELLDRIAVMLGGRTAEEIKFNEISTGAQNDLQRATEVAKSMVTEYGMSEKLGMATFSDRSSPLLGPSSVFPSQRDYSEQTAREIDQEVKSILDSSHERVRQLLTQNRNVLECLAKQLMEKEIIERDEFEKILAQCEKAGGQENASTDEG